MADSDFLEGSHGAVSHHQLRRKPLSTLSIVLALLLGAALVEGCASTAPSAASTQPSSDPMGGDLKALDCTTSGYIVQIASELEKQAYIDRIAEIRTADLLPVGAHYFDKDGDCNIFARKSPFWVLYAGPFVTPEAACPTRLNSPPDAIVRSIREEGRRHYAQCLCTTEVKTLPLHKTIGTAIAWLGELQQALQEMGYRINQPEMGKYGAQTVHTVAKFQDAVSLSPSGEIDTDTWERLKTIVCD